MRPRQTWLIAGLTFAIGFVASYLIFGVDRDEPDDSGAATTSRVDVSGAPTTSLPAEPPPSTAPSTSAPTTTGPPATTVPPAPTTTAATAPTTTTTVGQAPGTLGEFDKIGVVGCSNTGQAIEGYHALSDGDLFWDLVRTDIGGGGLSQWALTEDGQAWWAVFESHLATEGADAIWFMFCPSSVDRQTDDDTLRALMETAIARIDEKTGDVPIYLSPVNLYAESERCFQQVMQWRSIDIVDWAVDRGLALRGPDLGLLQGDQIMPGRTDCHLTEEGELFIGAQLIDFFE